MNIEQTTSENDTLIELGINPGIVDEHFNVSRKPVSFRPLESRGWGYAWEGVHSCNLGSSNGPEGVVHGFEFTAPNSHSSFRKLMETWEEVWLNGGHSH